MKWLLNIIGVILILVGVVWILQGINILPGSFMTGNLLYTYLGIGLDIVGILILFLSNRRASA
jgi:hypothetical protein